MPETQVHTRVVWRSAEPLIAAALGAHIAVLVLTRLAARPPLLTALIATVVFAGVSLSYAIRRRTIVLDLSSSAALEVQAKLLSVVIIGAGAWLLGGFLGTGAEFYCSPLVPWRIEIALFGSFTVGLLTVMARPRRRGWTVYPVVMIAFLWIAPFYGFFSAPMFLGIGLSAMCPDRPMVTVVISALGMIAGEQIGRAVAGWLSGESHVGPGDGA